MFSQSPACTHDNRTVTRMHLELTLVRVLVPVFLLMLVHVHGKMHAHADMHVHLHVAESCMHRQLHAQLRSDSMRLCLDMGWLAPMRFSRPRGRPSTACHQHMGPWPRHSGWIRTRQQATPNLLSKVLAYALEVSLRCALLRFRRWCVPCWLLCALTWCFVVSVV